ncbi:TAXI family TRAP transporter solute-binding subunit [Actinoalloteichus caeruleus]|uniref:TAXI family TRAP transporter solute-binding subunit n=1 Tax=Actinoalloteichus cyanogriseus TaxID=2893586 RepID=UPI00200C3E8D|nr:TAXI family TRAP transporter solute-binding subunit [Actinoalloteichus caeruleus]
MPRNQPRSAAPSLSRRSLLRLGAVGGTALALGLPGCSAGGRGFPPRLVLATGPEGAVFREIGGALAEALDQRMPDTDVEALPSSASVDNLSLLSSDDAQLALCSLDAVVGAEGRPADSVSAIGRLYDSFLQLAVLNGSPVRNLSDLAGLRVSIGASGSGTEFIVTRLLDLTGVEVEKLPLPQAMSAASLAGGEIDAAFTLTGIPTPALTTLAGVAPFRLVPLDEEADRMADAHRGAYIPATVPATTYHRVPPCPTVAVPNVLLVRNDVADQVATLVTEVVFTESGRIAANRPEAARINVRTGIATGPVPLHPGARDWFEDAKR